MSACRRTLTGLVILAAAVTGAAAESSKPNVVIVVADDLGLELGCYGHPAIKTPHIDALAKESTRFTRAYCATSSCSASRSVLMTGLFNHAIGHYGHAHAEHHFSTYESVRSLPRLLSEAGYRTCNIGKYHLAPEAVYPFDAKPNEGIQGGRNAVRMAENAEAWIQEDADKPFFLYFCSPDPHRGGPGGFGNRPDDPEFYPGVKPVRYDPEKVLVPSWLPDSPESRKELSEFYAAISRLDQGVGRLMDALKRLKQWDNTLVIFLSDNGPPFPGAKTNLYESGARLPLLVKLPGQKDVGHACDALVSWVDIAPTVLDVCGVVPKPSPPIRPMENNGRPAVGKPQPYTFHGRSFRTVVEKKQAKEFDEIFASHTFHEVTMYYPMRAIVRGRYKYIWNIAAPLTAPLASDLHASPTWQATLMRKETMFGVRSVEKLLHRPSHELYDLEADPNELKNLAEEPAYQDRRKELQSRLKAWQQATRDPWISKWEYE